MQQFEMIHKFLLVNDTDVHDTKHKQFFENIADVKAYIDEHKLHITHMVYDLRDCCVDLHNSNTNKDIKFL